MLNWIVKGERLENYLQACRDAVKNITTFKRDYRLQVVFEHCTYEIAESHCVNVLEHGYFKDRMHKFTNDFFGNPRFKHKGFSPSTWQYISVLTNLVKHFGSLDGMRIVEIGGGYGGQCRTIFDLYKPECYHIIDLPEVCSLQRKYCPAECYTQPTGQEYDLLISNYALSEIDNNKLYIDEVVRKSEHGYITCNTDLVKLDFPHSRLPDIPGERETNYILIW